MAVMGETNARMECDTRALDDVMGRNGDKYCNLGK